MKFSLKKAGRRVIAFKTYLRREEVEKQHTLTRGLRGMSKKAL